MRIRATFSRPSGVLPYLLAQAKSSDDAEPVKAWKIVLTQHMYEPAGANCGAMSSRHEVTFLPADHCWMRSSRTVLVAMASTIGLAWATVAPWGTRPTRLASVRRYSLVETWVTANRSRLSPLRSLFAQYVR